MDLINYDLYNFKETYNTITHPITTPEGGLVDNDFRLTLIDSLAEIDDRSGVQQLISVFCK